MPWILVGKFHRWNESSLWSLNFFSPTVVGKFMVILRVESEDYNTCRVKGPQWGIITKSKWFI